MLQNLICIDQKCKQRRLISDWNEQFLHSECEPLLQFPQFVACLQNATKLNKQNLLDYLQSLIQERYLEFENRMISLIQQFVNTWKLDFIDRIANKVFGEISDYQFIEINNIEKYINDPLFVADCLRVLDLNGDFPPHFYLNENLKFQTQQFDDIFYQLDEILQYNLCVEDFLSNNQSFDFFEDYDQPMEQKIPLRGYKEQLIKDEQFDQESFSNNSYNSEISEQEDIYSQPSIPLKGYKGSDPKSPVPLKGYKQTDADKGSQAKPNEEKQKSSLDDTQTKPSQKHMMKKQNLPTFQEVSTITIFHNESTVGTIQISKKKTVARSLSSLGLVVFKGFLNISKQYQISLLLSKCNSKNKNYFTEIGIIDWDIFELPKKLSKKVPQRGVYSLNSLGKIYEDGDISDCSLDFTPQKNIQIEFQGNERWLIFQIKEKKCKIDLTGIGKKVSLFAQLENSQLLIKE